RLDRHVETPAEEGLQAGGHQAARLPRRPTGQVRGPCEDGAEPVVREALLRPGAGDGAADRAQPDQSDSSRGQGLRSGASRAWTMAAPAAACDLESWPRPLRRAQRGPWTL